LAPLPQALLRHLLAPLQQWVMVARCLVPWAPLCHLLAPLPPAASAGCSPRSAFGAPMPSASTPPIEGASRSTPSTLTPLLSAPPVGGVGPFTMTVLAAPFGATVPRTSAPSVGSAKPPPTGASPQLDVVAPELPMVKVVAIPLVESTHNMHTHGKTCLRILSSPRVNLHASALSPLPKT
jgi:hypothetical protein